jgi:hypothetical protein
MKAKRKWRWVTKDDAASGTIQIWTGIDQPTRRDHYVPWNQIQNDAAHICASEFTALTGITITPNRPHKIEFTARRIK